MKSKFIPKSQKKPEPKKEVLGQVIIEVYKDNTFVFLVDKKLSPEYVRARLNELLNVVTDNILLNKTVNTINELQNQAKILGADGLPIMSLNQDVKQ